MIINSKREYIYLIMKASGASFQEAVNFCQDSGCDNCKKEIPLDGLVVRKCADFWNLATDWQAKYFCNNYCHQLFKLKE